MLMTAVNTLASPALQSQGSKCLVGAVPQRVSSCNASLGLLHLYCCCLHRVSGTISLGQGSTVYISSTFTSNAVLGNMHRDCQLYLDVIQTFPKEENHFYDSGMENGGVYLIVNKFGWRWVTWGLCT